MTRLVVAALVVLAGCDAAMPAGFGPGAQCGDLPRLAQLLTLRPDGTPVLGVGWAMAADAAVCEGRVSIAERAQSVELATTPRHGTAEVAASGPTIVVRYRPQPGFSGDDVFSVRFKPQNWQISVLLVMIRKA